MEGQKNNFIPPLAEPLLAAAYTVKLTGISAVDSYLGLPGSAARPAPETMPFLWLETDAGIPELAKVFDGEALPPLRFPGPELADASAGGACYFRCTDPDIAKEYVPAFSLLSLTRDLPSGRFFDPAGVYPLLRTLAAKKPDYAPPELSWQQGLNPEAPYYRALMEGALIAARYGGAEQGDEDKETEKLLEKILALPGEAPPSPEAQRVLLTGVLLSPNPGAGLQLLKGAGFIAALWPELASLDDAEHSKEFHPEGNVWIHTLETFRYRKPRGPDGTGSLPLSLGLLLHDMGKPLALASGGRRFDGHAELGTFPARRFLERLEFEPELIGDVLYLVKNHMLPAALPRLPLNRTAEIMSSPLFPVLLELYRCDESSSFKGLDGYYRSSAAYRNFLRNRRNPYRAKTAPPF
jgi:poly(A) polymerase